MGEAANSDPKIGGSSEWKCLLRTPSWAADRRKPDYRKGSRQV